jgi:hypothetical protein
MLLDLLSLLLNNLNHGFLLQYNLIKILKQLGQLNHSTFNALNLLMSRAHRSNRRLRLTPPIAIQQGLLKDLATTAILDSGPDLILARVRSHNAVLSSLLVLHLSPELGFDALVLAYGVLEAAIDAAYLGC